MSSARKSNWLGAQEKRETYVHLSMSVEQAEVTVAALMKAGGSAAAQHVAWTAKERLRDALSDIEGWAEPAW